jgi:predicted RNase H-like HicB family nuclease
MTLHYPVVVVKEGRDFWAYVPDLPGVYGRGKTQASARKDIVVALKLYIEDCRADGEHPPKSAAKVISVSEVAVPA